MAISPYMKRFSSGCLKRFFLSQSSTSSSDIMSPERMGNDYHRLHTQMLNYLDKYWGIAFGSKLTRAAWWRPIFEHIASLPSSRTWCLDYLSRYLYSLISLRRSRFLRCRARLKMFKWKWKFRLIDGDGITHRSTRSEIRSLLKACPTSFDWLLRSRSWSRRRPAMSTS